MSLQFFVAMEPPTITQQQHKVSVQNGKPRFYEPAELRAARQSLEARLARYAPPTPYQGVVRLLVKWCFPAEGRPDGSYRSTKPDTDNLQKMLKDVMTRLGFWVDDAQVASEIIEKFWADVPGIFVKIEPLE